MFTSVRPPMSSDVFSLSKLQRPDPASAEIYFPIDECYFSFRSIWTCYFGNKKAREIVVSTE